MQKQIKAMQDLGLTDSEIAELLETDRKIDKGEKLFELPKELQQGAKKARMTGMKKPTVYNFNQRQKKIDEDKRQIISLLAETIENITDSGTVDINNPERELTFNYKGKKYKIVLSCPRS